MMMLHMPNPLLWGITAGFLEFLPYVGVVIGTVAISVTALLTFNNITHILLIPCVFFTLSSITGNVISPVLQGRGLELHPIIIFIAVIFWGWIWGVIGALIAIPLMSIIKIVCDNIKPLNRLSAFLGE